MVGQIHGQKVYFSVSPSENNQEHRGKESNCSTRLWVSNEAFSEQRQNELAQELTGWWEKGIAWLNGLSGEARNRFSKIYKQIQLFYLESLAAVEYLELN